MQYALVGAGGVTQTMVARLPRLSQQLTSVAAASYRLASRMANTLGAGFPLREFDSLNEADLILICTPHAAFDQVRPLLREASIEWSGKTLLFCDSDQLSGALDEFRERGAETGSLDPVRGLPNQYVAEGDKLAVRLAKHLAGELGGKVMEIASDKADLFHAAVTFSSSLFTPLIESCAECVRRSGVTGKQAMTITEALLQFSLREYVHAGRKSWSGAVADADWYLINRDLAALCRDAERFADYYRHSAAFALSLNQREDDAVHINPVVVKPAATEPDPRQARLPYPTLETCRPD